MAGRGTGEGTHVVGPGLDLLVELVLVLVPEGGVAHQQNVQDHTCRTQVHGWLISQSHRQH